MSIWQRAAELRAEGMTELRTFWRLRREFPNSERDLLVNAARLPGHHQGVHPLWTETGGALLRPVICRKPPKGA